MNLLPTDDEKPSASSVLDASALLAAVLSEPGAELVAEAIAASAAISAVNLSEIVSRLLDYGFAESEAKALLTPFEMQVHTFDPEDAWSAGFLRNETRLFGLSLGDRSCLALARRLGLPAITADRAWRAIDVGVEVRLIR